MSRRSSGIKKMSVRVLIYYRVFNYFFSQTFESLNKCILSPLKEVVMKHLIAGAATALLALSLSSFGAEGAANPKVKLETTKGVIVVELFPKAAPKTVANFLGYVKDGFFDGTIFHRVIKSFMIQGGGFTKEMQQKATKPPIVNEADNGLKNDLGTLAMARTGDPHSATAQFFINAKNNDFLNFKSKDEQGWGYCVFGKVVSGLNVVSAIENEPTGGQDVPQTSIVITKASLVETSVSKQASGPAAKAAVKDSAMQKAK
jgi:cyclophilin family peptidyl-prolyl cis-trans isomerase